MNLNDVVNNIMALEERHDLLAKQIRGVYFWKLIRLEVYYQISLHYGLLERAHAPIHSSRLARVVNFLNFIKNSFFYGAIHRRVQKDVLIFDSPRKLLIDGDYIDVFTHAFVGDLKADYEIIDIPFYSKHYIKASAQRSYWEYFSLWSYGQRFLCPFSLCADEMTLIQKIEQDIRETFSASIKLTNLIRTRLKIFRMQHYYYLRLFKKRRPKQIYLLPSYSNEAMIAAARECGVESIEFQHGVICPQNLAYSFPGHRRVPYFPDRMIMFGRFWYESTEVPLPRDRVIFNGFPYLQWEVRRWKSVRKEKGTVLFISQGTIGKRLAAAAFRFAKTVPDMKVIFKVHPGEVKRWRDEYEDLVSAGALANFSIVENEPGIYELIAKCEFAVSVYSMAVFEAFAFNVKVILLDLPGIEMMAYVLKKNYAKLARGENDIREFIRRNDFSSARAADFFEGIH